MPLALVAIEKQFREVVWQTIRAMSNKASITRLASPALGILGFLKVACLDFKHLSHSGVWRFVQIMDFAVTLLMVGVAASIRRSSASL